MIYIMKKLLFILVYFLFLLTSVSSFANYNTEVLATKMGNDPQVIQLLKNNLKLSLANGIKPQDKPLPDDILNKINAVREENIILTKAVNTKFPEFVNLKKAEQSEIIYSVLNSPALSEYWKCIENKLTTFAITVLGGGIITGGTLAIFKKCISTTLVVDVVADVATAGAAIPEEAAAAAPEVAFCKYLAGFGAVIGTIDVAAFLSGLFSC
jgi:hypothetical protein